MVLQYIQSLVLRCYIPLSQPLYVLYIIIINLLKRKEVGYNRLVCFDIAKNNIDLKINMLKVARYQIDSSRQYVWFWTKLDIVLEVRLLSDDLKMSQGTGTYCEYIQNNGNYDLKTPSVRLNCWKYLMEYKFQ